ncbi:S9 family peptidase [Pseudonocardia sediminis]|uniref:S9 family peptidase n=1 Tax=Pseudonocardia sediminis TaxID=1397368 RepID=UPI001028DDB2|nr:S9 family peptidase [Pseudonocardia sediminis]
MHPLDIGRLVTLGDTAVSPDGTRIAFTVQRVDLENNRYRSAVWLAAADGGSAPYQLTKGEYGDGEPVWSPDGTRLAFTSGRGEDVEGAALRIVPVGVPGETVTVCERVEAISEVAWSPDGARIAFVSRERTARYGPKDERAREPRRIDRLFSRLDGEGWIIDRPSSVFVVPVDGSAPPRVVAGGPFEHSAPAWSPDSRTLAVVAAREPGWDLREHEDLYLVDPDAEPGTAPRLLSTSGRSHRLPSFSPDGTRIATLVNDSRVVPAHASPAVVDARTGTERVLADGLDRTCAPFPGARSPIWDGEDLLFSIEDRGNVHLYRVSTEGPGEGSGEPERVLGGDRTVSGVDTAGGTTAFLSSTSSRLPELYVLDADGTERRITHLTDSFHAAVPSPDPSYLAVPSPAGDGDVDTWVLLPDGDGPAPVLLSIHGGPMSQYATTFLDEFRLWNAAGYAVVWCNPHGSTGFTENWARAIRAPEAPEKPGTGWGGIDADDVVAALDGALAAFPRLDADRVGVLGGSYGGFLTSWLVGHSDRFAAACSERAVNNLESAEWSSDIAAWFRWEIGVDHVEHPEVYRRMSPVTYVRAIETPLLILHSENDLRCPIEQADALFVPLRMLDRPVEYWRFPEESHGLSRGGSPRHRVARARIILDFFARHLGGAAPDEVPTG